VQIKPEALMIDIPDIKTELLLPREGVAAVDLGQAAEARLHIVTTGLLGGIEG